MTAEHELVARVLDGELEYDRLPPELRRQADAFLGLFQSLREERPPNPVALRAAVMARVRRGAESPWERWWLWVRTPRAVQLSPLTATLALAAAVAAAVLIGPRLGPGPVRVAEAPAPNAVITRFVLVAPAASRVAVTGDFVSWHPEGVALSDAAGSGMWSVDVPLTPGVHHYVFIIDGREWLPDPNASQVDDGFGEKNSVVLVPPRAES